MKSTRRHVLNPLKTTRQTQHAYVFISAGKHNTASLAGKLGVSVATASRIVEQLRKDLLRHDKHLVSVRSEAGFHYEVRDGARAQRLERDPLVTLVIPARPPRRAFLKPEDQDLYGSD
jgi:hypothetical protein